MKYVKIDHEIFKQIIAYNMPREFNTNSLRYIFIKTNSFFKILNFLRANKYLLKRYAKVIKKNFFTETIFIENM